MNSLEADLRRARELDVDAIADAIESIGFECTRCGACCRGYETADGYEPHTATVFPDEIRSLQKADTADPFGSDAELAESPDVDNTASESSQSDEQRDWVDVARPMPYGLHTDGTSVSEDDVPTASEDMSTVSDYASAASEDVSMISGNVSTDSDNAETFEWALAVDDCGDCTFYTENESGVGGCTVHADRPLVCQTYPFSIDLGGVDEPMGSVVTSDGLVQGHECEGLGLDISRFEAVTLAKTLKKRTIRELEETIAVRDKYESVDVDGVIVHDSEGQKRPDGTILSEDSL